MDASPFDPYYEWLGIPPEEQPASYYRLLGIRDFESSATVIANAADRQMAFLRTFQTGPHAQASQDLLNQISQARVILLTPDSREKYDRGLRECRNANASSSNGPGTVNANTGTASASAASSSAASNTGNVSCATSSEPSTAASAAKSSRAAESPEVVELPSLILPTQEPESSEALEQPTQLPSAQTAGSSNANVSRAVQDNGMATTAPASTVSTASADASPVDAEPFTGTLPPEVVNKWHQSQQAIDKYTAPARSMFWRFLSCFRYPTFVLRFCGGVFLLVGAHLLYTQYASQNGKSWLWLILGYVFLFTGIVYMLLYRTSLGRRYLRDVAWLLLVLGLFFIGEFVYMAVSSAELSIFSWSILIVKGVVALGGGIGTLWGLHSLTQQKKDDEKKKDEES